ncbi:MAG: hypothetical protein WC648_05335 [Candidatus Paceibacterota bacterium]|jgi:hypothetical protein
MNPLNYASLEASKKLVDVGIILETEVVFEQHLWPGGEAWELILKYLVSPTHKHIPAPSMAEVWRELPVELYIGVKTSYHLELVKLNEINRCTYRAITGSTLKHSIENINPTDALIELLIWTRKKEV